MLGELLIKILVLVLGYVYPAFECFKSIEMSRPDFATLHFWCQYWVIIAIMTAIEKLGDIFISWLPLYGESKLAFIVYLWHPRTRGTNRVYNTFLRPFMIQHERDIEKRTQEMLMRSMDLLVFYLKHFVDKGQSLAFQVLDHILSKQRKPSPTPTSTAIQDGKKKQSKGKRPSWFKPTKRGASPPKVYSTTPPSLYPLTLPSSPTSPNHPSTNDDEDDEQLLVKKVKEALHAAGVNLKRSRQ